METLDDRLQKRIHVSLYALVFLTVILGLSVLLEGCTDTCEVENEYVYYEPVYTTLDELRASVELTEPQIVRGVGKIYIKGSWLFVNEPGKGIHIIDNTNPSSPEAKHFLNIPGNYDLAVKDNTLYADSFIDLVALDISDINNIQEKGRLTNAFSPYNTLGIPFDAVKGLITDYTERRDVKVYETDCNVNMQPWGGFYCGDGIALMSSVQFDKSAAIAPGTGSGPGVGGSLARFTINADHLFTLDAGEVKSINITSANEPKLAGHTTVSWDMETIFPYKNNLFIGSRTGMYIMDITTPASPVQLSKYEHVRVCDPVVVQNDLAYVTLRSGTQCEGFANQLEVIDITNLQQPKLLAVHEMTNPHGLGIDKTTLFVCDGDDGLKVFDASDIHQIKAKLLAHFKDINAYDVIPFNNILIMLGEDGIFQYDYSNPKDIKFLSKIAISNEANQ
jgi:hypothetical protein